MKAITHAELVEILSARKGAVALGIESFTDARAIKTGNPYGEISKQSRTSGLCGVEYQAAINRRLESEGKEGSFQTESLWKGAGEYIIPGKVARHKKTGELYLAIQASEKQIESFPPRVQYFTRSSAGLRELTREQVAPFLPEKSKSTKQAAAGLEKNQQTVRLFSLKNILYIHMNGETFNLVPNPA